MSDTSPSVFFNSLSLLNDLEGEFEGSVLITQSTILPSRASALPGDVHPRIVSYRDAMVMFKPMTADVSFDDGITLNVIDEDNKIIFSTPLKTPEQLPEPTEKIDVNEVEFIEPESYDYIIKSQYEFDKMKDDVTGSYLSLLLETSFSIKIVTSDSNWLKDIYFPDDILSQNGKHITFARESMYSSNVVYAGKTIDILRGEKNISKM